MTAIRSLVRRADESGIPSLLIRLFLGVFFIYSAVVKIGEPIDFLKQIRLYGLLPETPSYFLNGTAVFLPWLELTCGVALVLGLWIRSASVTIGLMLLAFTPAIFLRAMAIHSSEGTPFFEIEFDCGCGMGVEIIWIKLCKNTGLFLLVVLAMLSRARRLSLDVWLNRRRRLDKCCRRCGASMREEPGELCESCSAASVSAAGAPDIAT